jgi:hypothetical protein
MRIVSDITTAPTINQIKLHSNNTQVNEDGFVTHLGASRPLGDLKWTINQATGWSASPSNLDMYALNSTDGADYDLGVGRVENDFSPTATDKIGIQLPIPMDMDTSGPVILEIYYMTNAGNNAGNINWKTSKGITGVGEGIGDSPSTAPTTIRDYAISSNLLAANSAEDYELKILRIKVHFSEAISQKETDDSSDLLNIVFVRDGAEAADTYNGWFSISQLRANYYRWSSGGHVK